MHEAEDVEIAVAKKKQAGGESPEQCDDGEDGVGQMSDAEEPDGDRNRAAAAGHDAQQAEQDEALEEKLLDEGPYGVSPEGP